MQANKQLRSHPEQTYNRVITVVGTDRGYVQLLDFTYLTKPKEFVQPVNT